MAESPALSPDQLRTYIERVLSMQPFMRLLGVSLESAAPGAVTLAVDVKPELTQHGGAVHGGVLGALADNAAGAAAGTLVAPTHAPVTMEYKINFLTAATGSRLLAKGLVLRAGRSAIAVESKVYALADGRETLCAAALATMFPTPLSRA